MVLRSKEVRKTALASFSEIRSLLYILHITLEVLNSKKRGLEPHGYTAVLHAGSSHNNDTCHPCSRCDGRHKLG